MHPLAVGTTRLLALGLILLPAGCAATRARAVTAPEGVPVFATASGERVDIAAVLEAADGADVVVLGERHGHPAGLGFHAELFARALERRPDAVLCLEFLTRETQHLVDAYLDGLLDWDAFEEAARAVPGSNPRPHRPLIEAARAAGAPVVAANAPRLYTRAAREHGYERLAGLTGEQRRLFDAPDELPEGRYRDDFFETVREHARTEAGADATEEEVAARLEGYYRAQCLWDMTMASSVARSLEAGRRPVFLVVGSFHCNEDGGTVQMMRRLRAGARTLVVSFLDEDSDTLLDEHRDVADFVAYAGASPSER